MLGGCQMQTSWDGPLSSIWRPEQLLLSSLCSLLRFGLGMRWPTLRLSRVVVTCTRFAFILKPLQPSFGVARHCGPR